VFWFSGMHRHSSHAPVGTERRSSWTSRDLPMPGSPLRHDARPACARAQSARSCRPWRSGPISGAASSSDRVAPASAWPAATTPSAATFGHGARCRFRRHATRRGVAADARQHAPARASSASRAAIAACVR
jgi:hypothetical protein